jgi:hypothetical protein
LFVEVDIVVVGVEVLLFVLLYQRSMDPAADLSRPDPVVEDVDPIADLTRLDPLDVELSLTVQNDFWTCQCALEIVIAVDGSSLTCTITSSTPSVSLMSRVYLKFQKLLAAG